MDRTILVTGASGFLGSALCADLCHDHRVVGIFRREPCKRLRAAAPGVVWTRGEVADQACLDQIFRQHAPIDYVIHFAAFTGFSRHWEDAYTLTNVIGTRNVIRSAVKVGAGRLLFAGSIASLEPPPPGGALIETAPAGGNVAYARSKAMGEGLVRKASTVLPGLVLRLGGVFTDWCELPPLFSVIRMWSRPWLGRMMPGKGRTGFPYIHRRDVVAMVRQIIEKDRALKRFDVFFGAPPGATSHGELFPLIRRLCHPAASTRPVHVLPPLARGLLWTQYGINVLRQKKTYEQPWMIDYVDRPLKVDPSYTRQTLGWSPDPDRHILACLPRIMAWFKSSPRTWTRRNINRNDQNYLFFPDQPVPPFFEGPQVPD